MSYDDYEYPNNLIGKEDDKAFTNSLEADNIASTTEFEEKKEKRFEHWNLSPTSARAGSRL